jgi:hypothetical protein
MSPGLSAETSTFSDTGKERKCFVGDLTEKDAEGAWMGDEVQVGITGSIYGQRLWVGYIGEDSRSEEELEVDYLDHW